MRNKWHRWDIKNWEAGLERQSWNSIWWAESNLVWQFQFQLNPSLAREYFIDVPVSPFPHFPLGGLLAAWALHSLLIYGAGLRAACVEFGKTKIRRPAIWLIGVSLDVVSIIEIHGCESIIIIFQIKPFFNLQNMIKSEIPWPFFIKIRLFPILWGSGKPQINVNGPKFRPIFLNFNGSATGKMDVFNKFEWWNCDWCCGLLVQRSGAKLKIRLTLIWFDV